MPGERRPFDTTRPHPARRYDYWLGGKDNFAADRQSANQIAEAFPGIHTAVIENRHFLRRAVGFLARDAGLRQFLDIGTGIPTSPNVHEIAQAIAPDARVVYVDNDPVVLAHARARMMSSPYGATAYVDADLRTPEAILAHPALTTTLDLSRPVGLLLVAVLHFLDDADAPYEVVTQLVEALPPGSHVVISHATFDPLSVDTTESLSELTKPSAGNGPFQARTRPEVSRFLDGLAVLDPGVVSIVDWWPERRPHPQATEQDTAVYGAVAVVP